jgi:hypothetical protein
MTVDAVAAARHLAGQQHLASEPRVRGRGELLKIRATVLPPPGMMTQT